MRRLGRGLHGARSVWSSSNEPDRSRDEPRRVVHDRRRGRLERNDHLDGGSSTALRARAPQAHPLHTHAGFTVGRWEGGALAARTTHVKAGFIRKTGVPLTDQATIDWRFFRHGDLLTVLMVATDPVYLLEPEIVSKSFRLSRTP